MKKKQSKTIIAAVLGPITRRLQAVCVCRTTTKPKVILRAIECGCDYRTLLIACPRFAAI